MSRYYKEGQSQGAIGAVVSLIVGVGIATLVLIFVGTLGGQTYNLAESDIDSIYGTVSNDTFTAQLDTAVDLQENVIQVGTLDIYNVSNTSQYYGLSNFSVNYNAGEVTLTNAEYDGADMAANYTHGTQDIQTNVKNGIKSSFEALEQTGSYLPLIVLAIVITLVMTLVLSMGMFGQGGAGGQTAL